MGLFINILLVYIFSYFLSKLIWSFLYTFKIYFKGRNYSLKRLKFLDWISSKLNDPLFFMAKIAFEDYENNKKYLSDPKIFFEYYKEQSQIEMEEIIKELEENKSLGEYDEMLYGNNSFSYILVYSFLKGNFNGLVNFDLYSELNKKEKELSVIKKGIKKQRRVLLNGS